MYPKPLAINHRAALPFRRYIINILRQNTIKICTKTLQNPSFFKKISKEHIQKPPQKGVMKFSQLNKHLPQLKLCI